MESTDADPEMIVVLRSGLEAPLRRKIRQRLESHGAIISQIEATSRYYFELRGEIAAIETLAVDSWPGVEKVVVVGDQSAHWALDRSRPVQPIQVGSTLIGPGIPESTHERGLDLPSEVPGCHRAILVRSPCRTRRRVPPLKRHAEATLPRAFRR